MGNRNFIISVGEHYHLLSRGVGKKNLFIDERDYIRFLFLILYLQSPVTLYNFSRQVSYFVRSQTFNIEANLVEKILAGRMIKLKAFCIMPNHFHLILQEEEEGGIAKSMQRILTAYAKYFNTKYKQVGHVFEGNYKAVHIEDNDQLLYTSAYVHKNPLDLGRNYVSYPWSSYSDYLDNNRWGELLDRELILDQFDPGEYSKWVKETTAKELRDLEVLEV